MYLLTSLINFKNSLDPSNDLMRGGVGGFVEVDDSVPLVLKQGSAGRGPTAGEGCEVIGLDIELVVVL